MKISAFCTWTICGKVVLSLNHDHRFLFWICGQWDPVWWRVADINRWSVQYPGVCCKRTERIDATKRDEEKETSFSWGYKTSGLLLRQQTRGYQQLINGTLNPTRVMYLKRKWCVIVAIFITLSTQIKKQQLLIKSPLKVPDQLIWYPRNWLQK